MQIKSSLELEGLGTKWVKMIEKPKIITRGARRSISMVAALNRSYTAKSNKRRQKKLPSLIHQKLRASVRS